MKGGGKLLEQVLKGKRWHFQVFRQLGYVRTEAMLGTLESAWPLEAWTIPALKDLRQTATFALRHHVSSTARVTENLRLSS